MTASCCCESSPSTVSELVERYPSLLAGGDTGRGINELLAECGYRLADMEDIIKAQTGEYSGIETCLACQVTKIISCI